MHTESNSPLQKPAATELAPAGFVLTNPEPQPHEPTHVGELLAQAREHAGMSIGDVANRLRMSVKQIEALERADYAVLPAGTFLRGFVRNFAKAVGLNVDEALKVLERTYTDGLALKATGVVAPNIAAEPVAFQSRSDALATPKSRVMIAIVLVACLVAVVWYWWEYVRPHRADGGRPRDAEASVLQPNVVVPLTSSAVGVGAASESSPALAPANPTLALPSPAVIDAVPATAGPVASPASATPATDSAPPKPAPAPAPAAAKAADATVPVKSASVSEAMSRARRVGDTGVVGFTFSGESWVEVIDGTGRAVLSRRYKAGDADEVSGRGPFSIVVGNAQSTRMAYNGREFDLAPHTRATVARVTVK